MTANPKIDLRITASRHLVDFASEGVDAAIRYSPAQPSSLDAVRLGTETVTPVCSATYAENLALHAPADMYRTTLLCGDIPEDWPTWFEAAGCHNSPPAGPRLGDDGAILQAAVDGQGVALGRSLLFADDIATGRLVAPFTVSLEASHAYWFVQPKGTQSTHAIDAVKIWLVSQFNA